MLCLSHHTVYCGYRMPTPGMRILRRRQLTRHRRAIPQKKWQKGMLGHPKGLCWLLCFFMLLFHGSSLLLMFFGLGILGQLCAELSLIVWFEWGEDFLLLLSFSFHLEVVIVSVCLAYLPSIYFGSLTRLLRPLRPRHLLRTCLAHIPHTHIPKTTYIYYDHDNSSYPSSSTPKGWPQVSRRPGRTVGLGPAGGIDFGCLNFGMMQPKLLIIFFPQATPLKPYPIVWQELLVNKCPKLFFFLKPGSRPFRTPHFLKPYVPRNTLADISFFAILPRNA